MNLRRISASCFCLLLAGNLAVSAQMVTLDANKVSLKAAFEKIEKASKYKIAYNSSLIDANRMITIKKTKGDALEIFELLLKESGCTYEKKGNYLIVKPQSTKQPVKKNIKRVTGQLLDEQGEPMIGVTVMVKGTTTGAVTDFDGNFTIEDVPAGASKLQVSYIGYETKDVQISSSSMQIKMNPDNELLDEVVVVGYGTQKKANLTGAVTSMKNDDLLKAKAANSTNALIGRMPGIIAKQASGEPGADYSSIYIRGIATFRGDTQPAYIIDGVERSSGDFARMDPNDIESINVLKDAASAAIFGMRGANGVIVITTKRGAQAKPTIKYSGNLSLTSPTKLPKYANSYDYARLYNQFMGQEIYSAEEIEKFRDGSDRESYPNTNWYDEMLSSYAVEQQHNVSVSGGSDKMRYYVSGGFLNQGGLWDDINYKRYNLRSNIDSDITSTTHLKVDLSGRVEKSLNSGSASGIFAALMRNTPVLLCRYDDGRFAVPDATHTNVVAYNQPGGSYGKSKTFVGDAVVELEQKLNFITQGLSIKGTMAYSYQNGSSKNWTVSPYIYSKQADGSYLLAPRTSPSLGLGKSNTENQEYQLQLNYDRSFGNHNISAMAMALEKKSSYENSSMQRVSFDSEVLDQMDAGNSANQTLSAYDTKTARISYLGRLNYNFANRYLAEFNIRRDGSENFAPSHRWGTFMSGSLGWVISEEKFFEPLRKTIDFLKIRASYGTLGNDNTGGVAYPYYSRYELYSGGNASNYLPNNRGDYAFGSNVTKGLVPGAVANELATWERATKFNIALDIALWNSLSFSIDYFTENRSHILLQRYDEVPGSFGATLPLENLGKVKNKGVDMSLTYHKRIGDFDWSIGGNFTYARNEIVEMAEAAGTSEYMRKTGRPINGYYGYKTDGLFQSQEEIDNYAKQEVAGSNYVTKPGDIKYVDVNGDKVVNSKDMTYLGNGNVPEIVYGINGALKWKNMDFSFLLQGAGRVQVYLNGGIIQPYFNQGNLPQLWITDSWSETNRNARYPRLANTTHNLPATDVSCVETYLYDASYLRLKNIEIGYNLPKKWLSALTITGLRVYVNATNLLTFASVPQIDPENIHSQGWSYPQMKAFNFGLTLQF